MFFIKNDCCLSTPLGFVPLMLVEKTSYLQNVLVVCRFFFDCFIIANWIIAALTCRLVCLCWVGLSIYEPPFFLTFFFFSKLTSICFSYYLTSQTFPLGSSTLFFFLRKSFKGSCFFCSMFFSHILLSWKILYFSCPCITSLVNELLLP